VAIEAVGDQPPAGLLARLGAGVLDVLQILGEAGSLFLAALRLVPAALTDRGRVATQMVRVGTDTLWIGGLLSLFVGMVLVVQAADQVANVSQDILGPIVGLSMTKELGPVLMAFLLAGRAGSAMAAELGSMAVYDEINALRTMDIDPVRFLVMPRFIAATLALPVLIVYADFIGRAARSSSPPIPRSPSPSGRTSTACSSGSTSATSWSGSERGRLRHDLLDRAVHVRAPHARRTEDIASSTTAAVVWSFILILVFDFLIVRLTFALD
jgi:phospholipid/cholesterol/gamma-HCH transport system permease protein